MTPGKKGYNPEIAELFFKRLRQCEGNVTLVCKRLDIAHATPYAWKQKYPEFAKRWEELKKAA